MRRTGKRSVLPAMAMYVGATLTTTFGLPCADAGKADAATAPADMARPVFNRSRRFLRDMFPPVLRCNGDPHARMMHWKRRKRNGRRGARSLACAARDRA